MSGRDSGIVDIDGLPVFYETEGSGDPLGILMRNEDARPLPEQLGSVRESRRDDGLP